MEHFFIIFFFHILWQKESQNTQSFVWSFCANRGISPRNEPSQIRSILKLRLARFDPPMFWTAAPTISYHCPWQLDGQRALPPCSRITELYQTVCVIRHQTLCLLKSCLLLTHGCVPLRNWNEQKVSQLFKASQSCSLPFQLLLPSLLLSAICFSFLWTCEIVPSWQQN